VRLTKHALVGVDCVDGLDVVKGGVDGAKVMDVDGIADLNNTSVGTVVPELGDVSTRIEEDVDVDVLYVVNGGVDGAGVLDVDGVADLNNAYVASVVVVLELGGESTRTEEDVDVDGLDVVKGGVNGVADLNDITDVLGDELPGLNNDDNTQVATTAAINATQTNAKNGLACLCLYHVVDSSGGSCSRTGTPSYTGSFGTSVASSWIMDSSLCGIIDLGGGKVGIVTAWCRGRPAFDSTSASTSRTFSISSE